MPRHLLWMLLIVLTLSVEACSSYHGPIDNSRAWTSSNGLPGGTGYFAP
jgi:hypothetical protein